jgi:hypothetical protein
VARSKQRVAACRVNRPQLLLGLHPSSWARRRTMTIAATAPSAGSGGSRPMAGGRDRVRKSLYSAALPAALQWNPALVGLYARLKIAGYRPPTCPCRLREEASHLRQHRADQTTTMDPQKARRNDPKPMVAERSRRTAESELCVPLSQCLDRRIPDRKTFIKAIAAWENTATTPHQSRLAVHNRRCPH